MLYQANEPVRRTPLWRKVLNIAGWVSFAVAVAGWIFIFNYVGLI